ncbi:MAG TPA: hypothetical protein VF014_08220 [Casimicrobiaceae bacterium]|nr:hypothetical protein [Casimicrobiaceae bacterium]
MPVSKGHIKGRFQKGHVPVPNSITGKPGKVPGTKSAVSGRFLQDLAEHYSEEGHKVFRIVFRENPETYFKALVSLVPKELLLTANVNVLSELTDEQILDAVERMRQLEVLNGNGSGLVIDG